MTAPALTAAPDHRTDPRQDRTETAMPPRIAALLGLVRLLITFGRNLALPLQQHIVLGDPLRDTHGFGGHTVQQVLLRIARGLRRAVALEHMLLRRAASGRDLTPVPDRRPRPQASRKAPTRRSARPRDLLRDDDPPVLRLPTPRELAAELRRRPIGAILADICGDLGITRADLDAAQWDELQHLIAEYGSSFCRYYRRILQRCAREFAAALAKGAAALRSSALAAPPTPALPLFPPPPLTLAAPCTGPP